MKWFICILIALTIVCSLFGCATEANPGVTSLSTEATAPSQTTEATVATEESAPADGWESNPMSAWIPEPPGTWVTIEEWVVEISDVSQQEILAYAQRLKELGYAHDSVEFSDGTDYEYYALNEEAGSLNLSFTEVVAESGECVPYATLALSLNEGQDTPAESLKAEEAWNEHVSRAQVPEPPTVYWKGSSRIEYPSVIAFYGVDLYGMTYKDVLDYVELLKEAGFLLNSRKELLIGGQYSYSACNAEGWWVELNRGYLLDTGGHVVELRISNTQPRSDDWGSLDLDPDYYLPEPKKNWQIISWGSCSRIEFSEMTYQEALAYIQTMQQHTTQPGYEVLVSGILSQNDEEQTFEYKLLFITESNNAGLDVSFSYNADASECPGTMHIKFYQ